MDWPLRGFLFSLVPGYDCEVRVCRDLSGALSTWDGVRQTNQAVVALLHVGFARPDTPSVQALLEPLPSGLYVTEATRHSLPRECGVSGYPVGHCEGRDLAAQAAYRAVGPWLGTDVGCDLTSPSTTTQPAEKQDDSILALPLSDQRVPLSWWLARLRDVDAEISTLLEQAGVCTDEDFRRVRGSLSDEVRVRADRHRFRALTENMALADPFVIAQFLPDWANSAPLSALGLSLRCTNLFKFADLRTVSDVLALGPVGIMELRNFGRASLREFADKLFEFVSGQVNTTPVLTPHVERLGGVQPLVQTSDTTEAEHGGASATPGQVPPFEPSNLRAALDLSLAALREREAEALRLWLGMDGPPKVLENIGGALGVTRERARQLRNRGWERIRERWRWPGEVVRRLEGHLGGRQAPLFLDLIAAEDAWFDGFQENLTSLGRVIEDLAADTLHVWALSGRLIVTRCPSERWGHLMDAARATVEREIPTGVTRSDAHILISAVAVADGASELAEPLWERLQPALHFAAAPNREERLVSIGRRLRHALAAILDESERPLHMSEIVERLRQRGYVTRDDYGTQNIVRTALREAGGMLYGRSVYGLEKHLPVGEEAVEEALADLETIIVEGAPGRQWHCAELADELAARRPDLSEELDQFGVNVILSRSSVATYLGRLVWVGARQAADLQDRLDVAAMCEAALLRAGRPLSKRELREAIRAVRGLNHNFLPQASDRVVRLAHGMWGLADRDVGVSAENQKRALDALYRALEARQKGLHVTELFDALRGIGFTPDPELDEWELLGIAQSDARFRVGRGQLVGLASWTDVRRRSIGQALAEIQAQRRGPMTGETLHATVCGLIERAIPRASVASHAARAGFVYDTATCLWQLSQVAPDSTTPNEEEF